jgi:hypothetical protein
LSDGVKGPARGLNGWIGRGPFVFPSVRSAERPLSNVALLAALRRMGYEQGTVTVTGVGGLFGRTEGWQGHQRIYTS